MSGIIRNGQVKRERQNEEAINLSEVRGPLVVRIESLIRGINKSISFEDGKKRQTLTTRRQNVSRLTCCLK